MTNLYDILGVNDNASQDDIRKAYRKLSLKYHPDRNKSPNAESIFQELNATYEILGDKAKRNEYDRTQNRNTTRLREKQLSKSGTYGHLFDGVTPGFLQSISQSQSQSPSQSPSNFSNNCNENIDNMIHQINNEAAKVMNNILQNLQTNNKHNTHNFFTKFNGSMGNDHNDHNEYNVFGLPNQPIPQVNIQAQHNAQHNAQHKPIENIKINYDITLEQVFNGSTINITYIRNIVINNVKSQETIHKSVNIEPGIDTANPIILEGEGNQYENNVGNVEIILKELPHTVYKRNNLHLLMDKTISLKDSLTGFSFTFKHINDKQYTLQNKDQIIFPNTHREIPHLGLTNKNSTGSLFVVFNVEFPLTLDDNQKEQLKTIL